MSTKNTYEENLTLLRDYREGDRAAGERLVEKNRPLIYHLAGRLSSRTSDMEELCDVGMIGLVKAMNTFDLERGVMFSTYAVPLIFGEMRRFLRDDGMIKVSREEKRLCAKLSAERERLVALGEEVSIGKLAASVGVSVEDAASALGSASPVRSFEEAAYESEDGPTLLSTLTEEGAVERGFDRLALRMAMESLSAFQQKLIWLRYFRDLSQARCAELLGITQVKVSREEKKILERLRRELS